MRPIYTIVRLPLARRRFRRMRQILVVLARHGFGDIAQRIGLTPMWRRTIRLILVKHRNDPDPSLSAGRRLRLVFEELGSTYIKLGQVLANRPDLLPMDVIRELALLHDSVPPFPFSQVEETIERELGKPMDQLFRHIDPKPIAAASIGQVHRGVTTAGDEVAIKIMRPGIKRRVEEDLDLLKALAHMLHDAIPEIRLFDLPAFVDEFGRNLRMEMDFINEIHNMDRFRANFANEPRIKVTELHREMCTSSIIVMEFIKGYKVTDINWAESGLDPKAIAEFGVQVMMKSLFEDRFFHADPHPGNFFVMPDGRICLLDFGMMGSIDERRLDEILTFMVGVLTGDSDMLIDLFLDADLIPEDTDIRQLKREMNLIMDRFAHLNIEEIDIQGLLETVIASVMKHHVTVPTDLLLIGRAVSTIEGIGETIYPEFSPIQFMKPYLTAQFLKRALDPTLKAQQLYDISSEVLGLVRTLPRDLKTILRKLKKGQLELRHELVGEEERSRRKERSVNRAILAGVSVSAFWAGLWMHHTGNFSDPAVFLVVGTGVTTFLWTMMALWRAGGP